MTTNSPNNRIDYSAVTPATGTDLDDKPIPCSLANQMPAADNPGADGSARSDPDKTIPGPEAATGINEAEEAHMKKNGKK